MIYEIRFFFQFHPSLFLSYQFASHYLIAIFFFTLAIFFKLIKKEIQFHVPTFNLFEIKLLD